MTNASVELKVVHDLSTISQAAWDRLGPPDQNPFVCWTFLEGLERCGCAAPTRGWWPCHLTAWQEGELIAAAPAYVKADSSGDFSRDWGLPDSAAREGVSYYPKLVIGVPFSPVTGRRILLREGVDRTEVTRWLLTLARELCQHSKLSTIQVLYHDPEEVEAFASAGLSCRVLVQYHWRNRDYSDFGDWLAALPGKKRTQIRRERKEPARQGISIRTIRGEEMAADPNQWADIGWRLYQANSHKHYWGGTYLNHEFYRHLFSAMPDRAELVIAEREGKAIAGAMNLASPTHLFGRYWGCLEEHRFLHFNVCLYHSIDRCIRYSSQVFEGGAGGEHKLARGFDPTLVYTAYLFLDEAFHDAVSRYFEAETASRQQELRRWHAQRAPRVATVESAVVRK